MNKIILISDTAFDWNYNIYVGRTFKNYKVGDYLVIKFKRYLPFEHDLKRNPWQATKCSALVTKIEGKFIFVKI